MKDCYEYCYKGNRKEPDNTFVELYTIKPTLINQTYVVEVLYLSYNIYLVQFFLKNHRLSKHRFNKLVKANNNVHTLFLLNTLVNISKEIVKKDRLASFAFMGAPIEKELNRSKNIGNINPDNTVRNTKRHRIYSLFVKRYYSPDDFTHIVFEDSSCYLLMNNKNENITLETATDYLNQIIQTKIFNR